MTDVAPRQHGSPFAGAKRVFFRCAKDDHAQIWERRGKLLSLVIAAEKENKRIAVEVKSFRGSSFLAHFHLAVGQFVNYRVALESQEPDRTLYLAVPLDTYTASIAMPFAQAVRQRNEIPLIVFDPEKKALIQWIE